MGACSVKVTIVNLLNPDRSVTVDCLVDPGAAYSQLPRSLLASIGIEPLDERRFFMADGRPPLLGAMTLEGLGFGVDPLARRVVPIDLPLASGPLHFPPRRTGVSAV